MYNPNSPWKIPGVLNALCDLHARGISRSRIAAALNHKFRTRLSRNAVIGKLARMGLSEPCSGTGDIAKRVKRSAPPRPIMPPAPPPLPIAWPDRGLIGGITLVQLTDATCRWPLWGADSDERLYCGAQTGDGCGPYCLEHHQRARVSVAERRRLFLELKAKKENEHA
jgi:GcrA cell cycle regulator